MKKETILVRKKEVYSKSHKSKEILYEFKTALGYFYTKVFIMGCFKGCVSDKNYHDTTLDCVHEDALDDFKESSVFPSEENFRKKEKAEMEEKQHSRKCEKFRQEIFEKIKNKDLTLKEGQPRLVVYNTVFGGFAMECETFCTYILLKYKEKDIFNLEEVKNFETSHATVKGHFIGPEDLIRHDPLLIELVKEIEFNQNNNSCLKICEVEGLYYISNYDGKEKVFDSKNLKAEDGWFNIKTCNDSTEIEIVQCNSCLFWIENETFCKYILRKFDASKIKNLEDIQTFKTSKAQIEGCISEIEKFQIPRHDPLLVNLVKEIEIEKYKNKNEFSIGTVRGTYWVKTDDCYPERIVEYNDLNWC